MKLCCRSDIPVRLGRTGMSVPPPSWFCGSTLTSAGFRVIISAISTIAIQAEFFASFHKSEAELFGVTDMRSIGLTLALLFIAESAWAQVRDQQPIPAPKIEMGADGVKLAMGSSGGRASVEARVNGEGPYRFFFDTGE